MRKTSLFGIAALIIIVLTGAVYFVLPRHSEAYHEHANFAVYLDGFRVNFSHEKYFTTEENEVGLREFAHMHEPDSGVIHLHKEGATLGMFFESIGMKLNSTCFVIEEKSFCNSQGKTLKIFVNGNPANSGVVMRDLDRILVTFGSSDMENQLDSVPSNACIYSEKCDAPAGFIDNEAIVCKSSETSCSV